MARLIILLIFTLSCSMASAQDKSVTFGIGGDVYLAGEDVQLEFPDIDDTFLAGETVRADVPVTGSAHAAGRKVTIAEDVGSDLYAMGYEVTVNGSVAEDASVMGYEILIEGDVGGDLRAAGSEVTIAGNVQGYALLAGETLQLDGTFAGDVSLAAENVDFGRDARIAGTLTVYEEDIGELDIPESVVPEDRVVRKEIEEWERADFRPFSWQRAIGGFVTGVLMIALIAAVIAGLVPEHLAAMRRRVLDAPFWTLWIGFLTLSTVVGAALVVSLSIVGLILAPAVILLAFLGAMIGYVVGAYAFGVGLMLVAGMDEPTSLGQRVIAAVAGALIAGLIGLVPFLGWLFVLALSLAGVGAISIRVLRPGFFVDEREPTEGA